MARILKHTPPWLLRPSPGFNLFASSTPPTFDTRSNETDGHLKTVAHRGTEVFVVVDNELRWSDLVYLRDEWESGSQSSAIAKNEQSNNEGNQPVFRVLKVPVSRKIRQLILSPNEDYLAIVTSHTIHVAILPDPSHLSSSETGPVKLRTFQVGPTAHVVDRAALATTLWHPLGVNGTCLITITQDAIVRLWELDWDNRWSVDVASLAIDLKKLGNGSSTEADVTPSKYLTSKGFSPDSFEMQVSAACFGENDREEGSPWASMTLWVAMQEGDVYALCPLLPGKFQMPSTTSARMVETLGLKDSTMSPDKGYTNTIRQQKAWLSSLEAAIDVPKEGYRDPTYAVYRRPTYPSAVPALQGPFVFAPDVGEITGITDITAMTPRQKSDEAEHKHHGRNAAALCVDILCIATCNGKVHICLDAEGVEPAWPIPEQEKSSSSSLLEDDGHVELLHVETLSLAGGDTPCWPMFTTSSRRQPDVLVTHINGVSWLSLTSWTERLAAELAGAADSGVGFRLNLLIQNAVSQVEVLIDTNSNHHGIPACINVLDADMGNFVLAVAGHEPKAVVLDDDEYDPLLKPNDQEYGEDADDRDLRVQEARPAYQKAPEFWYESAVPAFLREQLQSHHGRGMTDEIRLSPMSLKTIMEAHRILSHETYRLGLAAADLFRRCERMQTEFKDQIRRANNVACRIDSIADDEAYVDEDDDDAVGATAKLERRVEAVHSRQVRLAERHDALRRRIGKISGRALNEKEKALSEEVQRMDYLVCNSNLGSANGSDDAEQTLPWQRVDGVKAIAEELVSRSKESAGDDEDNEAHGGSAIPAPLKRAQSEQINDMLERESALIEAMRTKVERLGLLSV